MLLMAPTAGPASEGVRRALWRAQVLQRVIKGDYKIPPGVAVSPHCRDLLARILVVDPSRRIDIQGIQQHPWCAALVPGCSRPSSRVWTGSARACMWGASGLPIRFFCSVGRGRSPCGVLQAATSRPHVQACVVHD